jgi:hypothetical protein
MKTHLDAALAGVGSYADPCQFDKFRSHLDPTEITKAIDRHDRSAKRRGRLAPAAVLWLSIAMALFRSDSIEQIVVRLRLARPGRRGIMVSPGAIPAARERLGEEPVRTMFEAVAPKTAHAHAQDPAHRWQGLALYGVDGSTLRAQDTVENRTEFGGHRGRKGSGQSGYPLVRLVALMALGSHLLAGVRFGPYKTGEITYAQDLWKEIPDDSLTILDRAFLSAGLLIPLGRSGRNRHWLLRLKKNTRYRIVKRLGPGDWLVELTVSHQAREKDSSLPKTFQARVVCYQHKGFRPQKLITSLLDSKEYPAAELVTLYHRRWELELGFAEIKTTMLEQAITLRSKMPWGVRQEIWGLLLAYHLVRSEAAQLARTVQVDANRISMITLLRRLRDSWFWWAVSDGQPLPQILRQLWDELVGLILPPRRSGRRYPRAVKIKMSKFKRKRPVVRNSPAFHKKAA